MRLAYKTRKMKNPRNLQKVLFTSSKEDFENQFTTITDIILDLFDCAIWYQSDDETINESELSDFQLIVIPISNSFLENNCDARLVHFPYAIKHNIPLLLVGVEKDIASTFSLSMGHYQLYDITNTDPTEVPYRIKIKNFLNEILISPALISTIRSVFDAYIFMSYRKIDRVHAQKLMKMIHNNPSYKKLAIWYDEFLDSRETYDNEIEAALSNSNAVALVVTPNLIESQYIAQIEYPTAKKMKKTIIPVVMEDTDIDKLKKYYENLPHTINGNNIDELTQALSSAFEHLALTESDTTLEHNYFLGLAYLNGIHVEINPTEAFELISGAAKGGITDAIKKLSQMYKNGQGIKESFKEATAWWIKYINVHESNLSISDDEGIRYLVASEKQKLGDYLIDYDSNESLKYYTEALEDIDLLKETKDAYYIQDLKILCRNRIGNIYYESCEFDKASENYKESLQMLENLSINDNIFAIEFLVDRLWDLYNRTNKTLTAYNIAKKMEKICEMLCSDEREDIYRIWLKAISRTQATLLTLNQLDASLKRELKGIKLYEYIISKWETEGDLAELNTKRCFTSRKCMDLYKRYDISFDLLQKSIPFHKLQYEISIPFNKKYENGCSLIELYADLAYSAEMTKDFDSARLYYEEADKLLGELKPYETQYRDYICKDDNEELIKELFIDSLKEVQPKICIGKKRCSYSNNTEHKTLASCNEMLMEEISNLDDLIFNINTIIDKLETLEGDDE